MIDPISIGIGVVIGAAAVLFLPHLLELLMWLFMRGD